MNYSPILIVSGEPNSVFLEIFFKTLKLKIKSPLILISSEFRDYSLFPNLVNSIAQRMTFVESGCCEEVNKYPESKIRHETI